MTFEEFILSVENETRPPDALPESLQALWYAEKGDWDKAHRVAQDIHDRTGSWIHANLHREEGDIGNARYWYASAGKPESKRSVQEERHEIIKELL